MRPWTFLFVCLLVLIGVFAFAQTLSPASAPGQDPSSSLFNPQSSIPPLASDGIQMWRRAEIRVVPEDLFAADKAELASLREQIAHAESDSQKVDLSAPALREQISRQMRLMRTLLNFAERQYSDQGKSAPALAVQKHLNQIEGQRNCEACHAYGMAQLR
jgi:hypothetical protein